MYGIKVLRILSKHVHRQSADRRKWRHVRGKTLDTDTTKIVLVVHSFQTHHRAGPRLDITVIIDDTVLSLHDNRRISAELVKCARTWRSFSSRAICPLERVHVHAYTFFLNFLKEKDPFNNSFLRKIDQNRKTQSVFECFWNLEY